MHSEAISVTNSVSKPKERYWKATRTQILECTPSCLALPSASSGVFDQSLAEAKWCELRYCGRPSMPTRLQKPENDDSACVSSGFCHSSTTGCTIPWRRDNRAFGSTADARCLSRQHHTVLEGWGSWHIHYNEQERLKTPLHTVIFRVLLYPRCDPAFEVGQNILVKRQLGGRISEGHDVMILSLFFFFFFKHTSK